MIRLSLVVVLIALFLAGCLPGAVEPLPLMTGVAMAPTVIARLSTPKPCSLHPSSWQRDCGSIVPILWCLSSLSSAKTTGLFGPSHDGMALVAQNRLLNPAYQAVHPPPVNICRESIPPEVYIVEGSEVSSHSMPSYAHVSLGK